jgi:hypothetical protein
MILRGRNMSARRVGGASVNNIRHLALAGVRYALRDIWWARLSETVNPCGVHLRRVFGELR